MMAGLEKIQRDEATQYRMEQHHQVLDAPNSNLFSAGTHSDTATKLNALDMSVTAYIKSNSLSAARRDAASMIRTNREDGRGYVRCGQIERLAGDISAASQWYEHGLRRVPESDPLHSYIKEQLRKITIASRPRDPVAVLPDEILEFVLSHLDFREIVRSLRVSRSWAAMLPTIRPMSDTVDFRLCGKAISAGSTKTALMRVRNSAKTLHLANLSEAARRVVKYRLNVYGEFQKLQTLSLSNIDWGLVSLPFSRYPLKEIHIGDSSGVEMVVVVSILKSCKSLEIGKFRNILVPGTIYPDPVLVQDFKRGVLISSVLKVLHLDCEVGRIDLESVLPCFPSLTEVEYCCETPKGFGSSYSCDLSSLQNLRKLRLHNISCLLPKLPASLEAWGSTSCSYSWPNEYFEERYYHLCNLRVLDMSNCSGRFLPTQFLPPRKISGLKHLNCVGLRPSEVILIPLDLLENLRVLRISGETMKYDYILDIFHLRELEELHITSSEITGAQTIDLLKSAGPRLQYIQCNGCPNITADVIKFAESKGITMVLRNLKPETRSHGGRRLRFAD